MPVFGIFLAFHTSGGTMKRILFLLLIISITRVTLSFAAVYKWTDENGGVHFTDDYNQIPQERRGKIEKQEKYYTESEEKKEPALVGKDKDKEEEISKDRAGRGESYWRERVQEWDRKMKLSQEKIMALRTKYNELTDKVNGSKSSAERSNLRMERDEVKKEIDDHRMKIEEAKMMLEKKIPEEAALFKAKPEWIKP
jgi:hypothetical protein